MPDFQPADGYVCVCTATAFGPLNLVPLYYLGRGRIRHLVILCAVAELDNPGNEEVRSAIRPAEDLRHAAFSDLGLALDSVTKITAHPDSVLAWKEAAQKIDAIAKGLGNLPIMVNLSGGTAQTKFGIVEALRALGHGIGQSLIPMFYSKYPAAPLLVQMSDNDLIESTLAESAEPIPTDTIIWAAGLKPDRTDPDYAALAAWVQKRSEGVRAIAERVFQQDRDGWRFFPGSRNSVEALNRISYEFQDPPFILNGSAQQKTAVRNLLDPDGSLEMFEGDCIEDPSAVRVARGAWLEHYVYCKVSEHFAEHSRAEVRCNVPLEIREPAITLSEADVLIRVGNQVHLIEVKARHSTDHLGQEIAKLENLRGKLGGTHCRAWLVAPFMSFSPDAQQMWNDRFAASGITFLNGPAAVEELLVELGRL